MMVVVHYWNASQLFILSVIRYFLFVCCLKMLFLSLNKYFILCLSIVLYFIMTVTLGQLLFQLQATKSNLRLYESLNFKSIKIHHGIIFNQICIKEGLFPKYTHFNLHDPTAQDETFTMSYRHELLKFQLNKNQSTIQDLQHNIAQIRHEIDSFIPCDQHTCSIINNAITMIDQLNQDRNHTGLITINVIFIYSLHHFILGS